jgi:hypothetical protein
LWISPIFERQFVQIVRVQYATDNLSGQQIEFIFQASVDIPTQSEPQCQLYLSGQQVEFVLQASVDIPTQNEPQCQL